MKKFTHQLAGGALAGACYYGGFPVALCCGIFLGSTAPDTLEIPSWRDGIRSSLIPHRTLTHWLLLWLGLLVWAMASTPSPVMHVAQGYCLGCILHVCMDGVTPMGVPILSVNRRVRLPDFMSATIVIVMTFAVALGNGYVMPDEGKFAVFQRFLQG